MLIVIMDANQLDFQGGKSIIELLTAVLRKFSNKLQKFDVLREFIAPYFVNFEAVGSKSLLDEKLECIKDKFVT